MLNQSNRKFLSWMLALFFVLSLASCGQKQPVEETLPESETLPETTPPETEEPVDIDALRQTIAELESEVEMLQNTLTSMEGDADEATAFLMNELSIRSKKIEELESKIAKYETVYRVDVLKQSERIDKLIETIEKGSPYVGSIETEKVKDEKTGKEVETEVIVWYEVSELVETAREEYEKKLKETTPAESGDAPETAELPPFDETFYMDSEDYFYPRIAVYYEDLTVGYRFAYNADTQFDSASVVKAPYVYSILKVIAEDEQNYLDKLAKDGKEPEMIDTDDDGEPDQIVYKYSDKRYDLTEVVKYDPEKMFREGSGVIQQMDEGTEFSYIDFIKYALEHSDNVAYGQLRARFDWKPFNDMNAELGIWTTVGPLMSASSAGRYFKEIYQFIKTNDRWGKLMADSMSIANHQVLIPFAVMPTKTYHKYGWDTLAYHDAAIVLDGDHPYILVVFSELDNGTDLTNEYLRSIISQVHAIHSNFYLK